LDSNSKNVAFVVIHQICKLFFNYCI